MENRFSDLMGDIGGDSAKPSKQLDSEPAKKSKKAKPRIDETKLDDAPYKKKYAQPVKRGTESSVGKSANSDYDKVTVYIRSDVAHALRVVSAFEKREMSQLVEDAIIKAVMQSAIGKATLEQPNRLDS